MKRFAITGLALLTTLTLGALSATSASSNPGVLPAAENSGEGGTVVLETTNKESISCTSIDLLLGKFLKENFLHVHFFPHLRGCKASGIVPVNTLGDEKEVILFPGLTFYCLVEPKKLLWGMFIQPINEASGEPMTVHIEIPAIGQLVLLKGGVIAVGPEGQPKGKELLFLLKGAKGSQTEGLKCEIEGKTFLHTLEAGVDSGTDFPASMSVHFTLKFVAEMQLMDT